jgi:hypothetical protein
MLSQGKTSVRKLPCEISDDEQRHMLQHRFLTKVTKKIGKGVVISNSIQMGVM